VRKGRRGSPWGRVADNSRTLVWRRFRAPMAATAEMGKANHILAHVPGRRSAVLYRVCTIRKCSTFTGSPPGHCNLPTLVLCMHSSLSHESNTISPKPNRVFPESMSGSEYSLLDEQMQGKQLYYKECATPPRVRRSTGSIHREVASWYVLLPNRIFSISSI
jgi:hypothetical protein